MKRRILFNGIAICIFVGSIIVLSGFYEEECCPPSGYGAPCSHSSETDKTITGLCDTSTEMKCFKCICIPGQGNPCVAGKCECKHMNDAHDPAPQQ